MSRKSGFDDSDADARKSKATATLLSAIIGAVMLFVIVTIAYASFQVEVPARHVAVLIQREGKDLPGDAEIAPDATYKGVQLKPILEGRTFLNPYRWDWHLFPQSEVPDGKLGVLIRLFGDDLPYQDLLAAKENQKGIVPGALRPGRYPDYSNPFAYRIELHDAVTVPAGFQGVVTLVTGTPSKNPNRPLVDDGERGVQSIPLEPGTYYVNPYEKRISLMDCRTKKLNLSDAEDMGFPSKDGFWIRLDGAVQFHVVPEKAAQVFVTYNEDYNGDGIYDEIAEKVIMPYARSFCRLAGSTYTGRQFIEGKAREEFQSDFQKKMVEECMPRGIAIDSALISKIFPPEPIAEPVRRREIAKQQQAQYLQEILQQQSEAKLVIEKMRIEQKKRVIDAEKAVIQIETKAKQDQSVAVTKAEQELSVAKTGLEAAKDLAAAVMSRGKAEADVIKLQNEADASGLRASVEAFNNDGHLFAQQVLYEKLAPAFKTIMANSSDSPLMRVFDRFQQAGPSQRQANRGANP